MSFVETYFNLFSHYHSVDFIGWSLLRIIKVCVTCEIIVRHQPIPLAFSIMNFLEKIIYLLLCTKLHDIKHLIIVFRTTIVNPSLRKNFTYYYEERVQPWLDIIFTSMGLLIIHINLFWYIIYIRFTNSNRCVHAPTKCFDNRT